jgi:hypothetical protein
MVNFSSEGVTTTSAGASTAASTAGAASSVASLKTAEKLRVLKPKADPRPEGMTNPVADTDREANRRNACLLNCILKPLQ